VNRCRACALSATTGWPNTDADCFQSLSGASANRRGGRGFRLRRHAPGKINLYVGKTAVKFNIPEAEAVDRLVDLIREHGKWAEPEARTSGDLATH